MQLCGSCFGIVGIVCKTCGGEGRAGPALERRPFTPTRPDVAKFGTEEYPLHASHLQKLMQCPWREVIMFMFGEDSESGAAADTGSATHAAVEAWHKLLNETGKSDLGAAIKAMVDQHGDFPKADLEEAAALFQLYSRDPRNREAEVVAIERHVRFQIPAAPEDPTQTPILIVGTCDQVRRDKPTRKLKVWDLKTSKKSGNVLKEQHAVQIAAYCAGISLLHGEPVDPGGLICPRHYPNPKKILPETAPDGVFFPFDFTWHDVKIMLWGVRRVVAAIRSGEVWQSSGEHCTWCPARTPQVCIPLLRNVLDPITMKISLPVICNESAVDLKPEDMKPLLGLEEIG